MHLFGSTGYLAVGKAAFESWGKRNPVGSIDRKLMGGGGDGEN